MKNKISVITAVSLIALPFVGFTFYQLLKYVNTGKFLLSHRIYLRPGGLCSCAVIVHARQEETAAGCQISLAIMLLSKYMIPKGTPTQITDRTREILLFR